MKFRYLVLLAMSLWAIGFVSFNWVEKVDFPYQFLGMGRWLSHSGYLARYAVFGLTVVMLGIVVFFTGILREIYRNNTCKASM